MGGDLRSSGTCLETDQSLKQLLDHRRGTEVAAIGPARGKLALLRRKKEKAKNFSFLWLLECAFHRIIQCSLMVCSASDANEVGVITVERGQGARRLKMWGWRRE